MTGIVPNSFIAYSSKEIFKGLKKTFFELEIVSPPANSTLLGESILLKFLS